MHLFGRNSLSLLSKRSQFSRLLFECFLIGVLFPFSCPSILPSVGSVCKSYWKTPMCGFVFDGFWCVCCSRVLYSTLVYLQFICRLPHKCLLSKMVFRSLLSNYCWSLFSMRDSRSTYFKMIECGFNINAIILSWLGSLLSCLWLSGIFNRFCISGVFNQVFFRWQDLLARNSSDQMQLLVSIHHHI